MISLTATEKRLGIHDTSRLWRLGQPPAQARVDAATQGASDS